MTLVLRIGTWIFVAAAGTLLVVIRASHPLISENSEYVLIAVSVLTLPAAFAQTIIQSDAKSRRNWAIFIGLVVVLAAVALLVL